MISGVQEARWKRFLFQLKLNLVFPPTPQAILSSLQALTDWLTVSGYAGGARHGCLESQARLLKVGSRRGGPFISTGQL